MIFAPSGASVAAPTTSLPEEIGGQRNWDYRFCWIRDSNFMIDALLQLGCHEEARSLFWWFMQATALTVPSLHVLYRLDGGIGTAEREIDLSGYRGSRPVRVGNGAVGADPARHLRRAVRDRLALQRRASCARSRKPARFWPRIADHVCEHLAAAGLRHLGGAQRAVSFHALEGDVLGGARSRGAAGRASRAAGGPRLALARAKPTPSARSSSSSAGPRSSAATRGSPAAATSTPAC